MTDLKARISIKCSICGKEYTVSYERYRRRGRGKAIWKCRKCTMATLSKNDKDKRSMKIRESLANKTQEEKAEMTRKRLSTISNPEFKDNVKQKIQEAWRNKSYVDMKKIADRASSNTKRIWDNMDEDIKKKRLDKLHDAQRDWYNNLDEQTRQYYSELYANRGREYWQNASADTRYQHGQRSMNWWNSLSSEERSEFIHSILKHDHINALSKRFEDAFSNCKYSGKYNIKRESTLSNVITHSWDYGIYDQNGELVMVVDLDGAYFHADICDYDGVHSREEYDEKRWLSLPVGMKCCVIYEKYFDRSFEYMLAIIDMSFNEYVDYAFNLLRKIPFPRPRYSDMELMNSFSSLIRMDCNNKHYVDLLSNVQFGMRVIHHFHSSVFNCIEEFWYDDEWLKDMISSHQIFHNPVNVNKLLLGFHIDILSPAIIKIIISKYIPYDGIYDPSGNPSILLATLSLNKHYAGPISTESMNMYKFLRDRFNVNGISDPGKCMLSACKNDDEIDELINKYTCELYVFIVNETCRKVVNVIENKSYFSNIKRNVVVIQGGN